MQRAIAYCGAAFSILWVLATFLGTFSDYWRLREAIRLGHFEVVEGKVVDFVPMPPEGHVMEQFTVNGHHYEYADFMVTAGFNNTQSHGGPTERAASCESLTLVVRSPGWKSPASLSSVDTPLGTARPRSSASHNHAGCHAHGFE